MSYFEGTKPSARTVEDAGGVSRGFGTKLGNLCKGKKTNRGRKKKPGNCPVGQ